MRTESLAVGPAACTLSTSCWKAPVMARKLIIDCDPGIDDAIALCLALFDPRLEVVAVTASAGNVDGHQASRNVQTVLELLDPARWPRVGAARTEDSAPAELDRRDLNGADGLGNLGVRISELHRPHASDKVIADEIRNAPGQVTVLTLGPLTNIARVLNSDPDLATMIDRLVISGGSLRYVGDVTATAEFNMHCDPSAARFVLRAPTTKTLVPRDITNQLVLNLDFLDRLPDETSRAGRLLRAALPYLYRSFRQHLGLEGIQLGDAIALLACVHPELFEAEEMAGDVEVSGNLTTGTTVFDRRPRGDWRKNMEVVTEFDRRELAEALVRGLRYAAQETRD